MLKKSHPLGRYKRNGGRNQKKLFFYASHTAARIFALSHWAQDTTLWQFLLRHFCCYLFDFIFSGIVWTNRLHDSNEGIYFHNNCCYGNRENIFFQWSMKNASSEKNDSLKKQNLQVQTTTEKIELVGYLILGEIKLCNLKSINFEKKSPKCDKTWQFYISWRPWIMSFLK